MEFLAAGGVQEIFIFCNAHADEVERYIRETQLQKRLATVVLRVLKSNAPCYSPGDALRVTCVFDTSNRTSATRAGWGHEDEMCNLYLMVHAEAPRYASCTGSATGGGGRSKFDFESPRGASAFFQSSEEPLVAARPIGAFVVPPPAPLGAPRASPKGMRPPRARSCPSSAPSSTSSSLGRSRPSSTR